MNKTNVLERGIGINYKKERSEITLWAPHAKSVELFMCDKNIALPLQKQQFGYWHTIHNINVGDNYYFILDGEKQLPDPASLSQPNGVHGFSQVVDLNDFRWTDRSWKNPALQDYIFYELHIGAFTPAGTFAALEEKLDYLKELGITAIEIMPVAQFPGARNWGYDGVFPFAVQNTYGGAGSLQHLINECHKKGLAVVLDVVYNHLGPEGNYLSSFAPYFTDKYHTPWGKAINYDDAWCDNVRKYFIENVLMWLRDFHIDALRLDAVDTIKDFSPKHILKEMKEYVDELIAATGHKHHLIVECDLNDTRFIDPVKEGGYGIGAQWLDDFHHSLLVAAGHDRKGYYADFNGIQDLAKSYRNAYVYDGVYSAYRQKTFGTKTDKNVTKQFIAFSQNHDQVGNRMLGERTSTLQSFEMQKLLIGAVMISAYLPFLFMGEEWSTPNPFLYFTDHSDRELIEAVRKGRKAEFAAFHLKGEAPDPDAEETFDNSKLNWDIQCIEPHKTMLSYYKTLIGLRKHRPALYSLIKENLYVKVNEKQNVLILKRWYNDEEILCLLNFSKEKQSVAISGSGEWYKLFDSASVKWRGPADAPEKVNKDVTLQPESLIIYTNKHV
ncbi:MAG TPA: malto-oligosyltrehalose trehalohydrolase [Flavipsychrobacter sp.]|nr:malto-oligosyltrehalose trehalohydrolase [Flavipsychrobacter sp.]